MNFKFKNILGFIFVFYTSVFAQNFYEITDCEAGPVASSFWIPVKFNDNKMEDSVLIKITDQSKSKSPGFLKTDKDFVANFVFITPELASTNEQLPTGLYYWMKDAKSFQDVPKGIYPCRPFSGQRTFAKKANAGYYTGYFKKGTDWIVDDKQAYDPKQCKNTNPFTFTVIYTSDNKIYALVLPNKLQVLTENSDVSTYSQKCRDKDPTHLPRSQIFQHLFGMSEPDFYKKNKPTNFKYAFKKDINGNVITANGFLCGNIELNTYKNLEDSIGNNFFATDPHPSFNIIFYEISPEGFKGIRKFRRADVGFVQGRQENKDAVFQLASRPNGLEGGCEYRGKGFTDITGEYAVQGEEAAISAAPGGIFRMLGDLHINFFQNIPELAQKVTPEGDLPISAVDLLKINKSEWWKDLLICFHENIQVTTGLSCAHRIGDDRTDNYADCNEIVPKTQDQLIHQIPVCAINLRNITTNDAIDFFCQNLLLGFYTGTIYSSIIHKKYKIFLTAVGAGAFRNKPTWVTNAVIKAMAGMNDFGCNVYFVFMDKSQRGESAIPEAYQPLIDQLVKSIGGNVLKIRFNEKTNKEYAILTHYFPGAQSSSKIFNTQEELEPYFHNFLIAPHTDILALSGTGGVAPTLPTVNLHSSSLVSGVDPLNLKLLELQSKLKIMPGMLNQIVQRLGTLVGTLSQRPIVSPQPVQPKIQPKPVITPTFISSGSVSEDVMIKQIFAAAKAKVGDVPSASNVPSPQEFNFEEIETLKMQSSSHLRMLFTKYNKNSRISFIYKRWQDFFETDECRPHIEMLKQILNTEKLHKDQYYVFYNAFNGGIVAILFEIYQFLHAYGMLNSNQPLALRFYSKNDVLFDSIQQLKLEMNKVEQHIAKLQIDKCSYKKNQQDVELERGECIDHIKTFKNLLLSVNFALFGNFEKKNECSWWYFYQSVMASTLTMETCRTILKNILEPIDCLTYLDAFIKLITEYEEKLNAGELLQIFIDKRYVDQCAYWALDGGYNIDAAHLMRLSTTNIYAQNTYNGKLTGDPQNLTALKPYMENISTLLNDYVDNSMKLATLIKTYYQQLHFDAYDLTFDRLQARIFLPSPHLYNPALTKIIRYSKDNNLLNQIHNRLQQLFHDIINTFIKNKIEGKIDSFKLPTAFKNLDDFVTAQITTKHVKNEKMVSVDQVAVA
ncbi:MAG: hypothetical protein US49_C0005G0079 [candidate division TM6 bacterium GW2011_GWF2_37_49]|nr:MAG: hypothetical protein US49_C0005G0079 [candidate division TM6 bacterium GW2011_GWF2_37_49]